MAAAESVERGASCVHPAIRKVLPGDEGAHGGGYERSTVCLVAPGLGRHIETRGVDAWRCAECSTRTWTRPQKDGKATGSFCVAGRTVIRGWSRLAQWSLCEADGDVRQAIAAASARTNAVRARPQEATAPVHRFRLGRWSRGLGLG